MGMESAVHSRNPVRRALHMFVYGLCSAYLGITPPAPEKEFRFLGALLAVLAALFIAGAIFAWYLLPVVFQD
jgi:hypothetical protein